MMHFSENGFLTQTVIKNNEKTIYIGGSGLVYIIHISRIKTRLISKCHVWVTVPMPDIYSDNVAKRTWEYAGSHRSNVVCMSSISSTAWHSIYIKRCFYDRRCLSRQSGSQICNTEASWNKCVKWEKIVKHMKMCHWHCHCQREVGMAFVSDKRSTRCIFQVEKGEHPTERWFEGYGCSHQWCDTKTTRMVSFSWTSQTTWYNFVCL